MKIQEVICQELNLPVINTPAPEAPRAQNLVSGTSQAQYYSPSGASHAQPSDSGVSQPHVPAPGHSPAQNGVNLEHVEAPGNQAGGTTGGSDIGGDVAHVTADTAARSHIFQDQSMLCHFREMQRRQVEFIKKRVLLLERGLNAELQKEYFADEKTDDVTNDEPWRKVTDADQPLHEASDGHVVDQLPQVEIISSEEILAFACDEKSDRLDMARLFNEMSRIMRDNAPDSAEAYYALASLELRKNTGALEALDKEINQILSAVDAGVEVMDSDSNPPPINISQAVAAAAYPNGPGDGYMERTK